MVKGLVLCALFVLSTFKESTLPRSRGMHVRILVGLFNRFAVSKYVSTSIYSAALVALAAVQPSIAQIRVHPSMCC